MENPMVVSCWSCFLCVPWKNDSNVAVWSNFTMVDASFTESPLLDVDQASAAVRCVLHSGSTTFSRNQWFHLSLPHQWSTLQNLLHCTCAGRDTWGTLMLPSSYLLSRSNHLCSRTSFARLFSPCLRHFQRWVPQSLRSLAAGPMARRRLCKVFVRLKTMLLHHTKTDSSEQRIHIFSCNTFFDKQKQHQQRSVAFSSWCIFCVKLSLPISKTNINDLNFSIFSRFSQCSAGQLNHWAFTLSGPPGCITWHCGRASRINKKKQQNTDHRIFKHHLVKFLIWSGVNFRSNLGSPCYPFISFYIQFNGTLLSFFTSETFFETLGTTSHVSPSRCRARSANPWGSTQRWLQLCANPQEPYAKPWIHQWITRTHGDVVAILWRYWI